MVIEFIPINIIYVDDEKSIIRALNNNKVVTITSDYIYFEKGKKYRGKIIEEVENGEFHVAEVDIQYREKSETKKLLKGYKIPPKVVEKLLKKYGENAINIIKEKPYILLEYEVKEEKIVNNILFREVYNIDKTIMFFVYSILLKYGKDGHVYVVYDDLLREVYDKIKEYDVKVDESDLEKILIDIEKNDDIFVEEHEGKKVVYIRYIYEIEKELAEIIGEFIRRNRSNDKNDEEIERFIDNFESINFEFKKSQKKAVKMALKNRISIITGMPGTGKTTILKAIVNGYKEIYGDKKIEIVSMAGKAVERVSKITGIMGKTIHRFLKIDEEDNKGNNIETNDVDVLIIDEASMIDLELFYLLFKAIRNNPGIKILIVGDINQLPPIGYGQVFRDIIESQKVPITELKEIVRQNENISIIANSRKIIGGNGINFGDNPIKLDKNFIFIDKHKDDVISCIIKEFKNNIDKGYSIHDIQIIMPMKNGIIGSNSINRRLVKYIRGKSKIFNQDFYVNDRVIQVENNYKKGVYNGEIGIVERIEYDDKNIEVIVNFNGFKVKYKNDELNEIELAYAITAHKFQGSESNVVIFVISEEHKNMLNKNLVYVAVTRAKEKVIIIGSRDVFNRSVQVEIKKRNTRLKDRISMIV